MSVRVGVIGAGIMGADHARIIANDVPGAVLQVVCDADSGRAKTVAAETGAIRAETDPMAVIQAADVDAVLVASPDQTHGPLTLEAIARGKPVLCEKPLAPTAAEALKVVEAEAASGRRLVQVGFMRRFDPSYVAMKRALGEGRIGAPLMFHNFHRNVSAPSWFTSEMAITNSAPHEFDIARFVLGGDYARISVSRPRLADPAKPGAPVFMVLETEAGQLVTIEVNINATYGYDVKGELVGEKGSVSLKAPVATEVSLGLIQSTAYPADWRPRFAEAYRLQNQAWIRSIRNGTPAGASAWDGYAACAVAEAGVESLKQGRPVQVSMAERPALYD